MVHIVYPSFSCGTANMLDLMMCKVCFAFLRWNTYVHKKSQPANEYDNAAKIFITLFCK